MKYTHFEYLFIGIKHFFQPFQKKFYEEKFEEWVSEWLLFNANSAIFRLCHGENKLIFNAMMMRSTLY